MELSVILPAFNEGDIIATNLNVVDNYLGGLGIGYEIIVVNDGSNDHTLMEANRCQSPHIKILSYQKNKGKGHAIYEGMKVAQGEYRLFMDVDLSTEIIEIEHFLQTMKSKRVDVLIGNRNNQPLALQNRPWQRALFGRTFAGISAFILGCPLKDFTCGFKMFRAAAAQTVFPRQRIWGWAFDSELIFIARRKGLSVEGQDVLWHHCGNSKVQTLKAIATSLTELFKIRYYDIKGYYK
jgi:dolichyl-phosphate beta-glucosyltransferase